MAKKTPRPKKSSAPASKPAPGGKNSAGPGKGPRPAGKGAADKSPARPHRPRPQPDERPARPALTATKGPEPAAALWENTAAPESGPAAALPLPEILAPAGDMNAALAALAAGADALYLGLKHFSARMQADNFATSELAALIDLAHAEKRRIYVAMNTLVKPREPEHLFRLVKRLALASPPDALILQDPGVMDLARQAGFEGELHLSTLANVTHQRALEGARALGANRVILPRELSLDEVRLMDAACPPDMELELFVHGALCFCVSGRCWWSGYMGGKSGLRGRCVQPCRRVYTQKGRKGRYFSCLDLSLDSAARSLLALGHVRSWKIEGRKKGPHYVHNVVRAYRLIRDEAHEPQALEEAAQLLSLALGRQASRARFLDLGASPALGDKQTSSGLLLGGIKKRPEGGYLLRPRLDLQVKDLLRVGYEDEPWHATIALKSPQAAGQELELPMPRGKHPKEGTPVFLIDRKEAELNAALADWGKRLAGHAGTRRGKIPENVATLTPRPPEPLHPAGKTRLLDVLLSASLVKGKEGKSGIRPGAVRGLWLSPAALREVSQTLFARISWWLPPVIWPDEEEAWQRLIASALRKGARHLVLNAPWQMGLIGSAKGLGLTAGPFCNLANAHALESMRQLGFDAAIISPELGRDDILALPEQSPLPLGMVLSGFWPMGLSRHRAGGIKEREEFSSPKGEQFWMRRYGQNLWIYPAWPLDLTAQRAVLERAGYVCFVHMDEHPPKSMDRPERPGEFNWHTGIL